MTGIKKEKVISDISRFARGAVPMIRQAFYDYRWLFLALFIYIACLCAAAVALGAPLKQFGALLRRFTALSGAINYYFAAIVPIWFLRAFIAVRAKSLSLWLKAVWKDVLAQAGSFVRSGALWHGIAAVLFLVLAQVFFCIGKSLIPQVTTYSWDPLFAAIDKAMHFGQYPHQYISPFIREFWLEAPIYYAYMPGWLYVTFFVQGYCVFLDPDLGRRKRLLWTLFLAWVFMGILMAMAFASVGPVFYRYFYPDNWNIYEDVRQNMFAVNARSMWSFHKFMLWMAFDQKSVLGYNGISAMPSMHMALAFVNCLYTWRVSRALFVFSCFYAVIIYIGSIYLGWHYAIDSYVSIAAIGFLWWLTGRIFKPEIKTNKII